MKPQNIRMINYYDPSGVEQDPVFAWEYGEQDGSYQTAYRLVICCDPKKQDCIYDSGKVISEKQNNIEVKGLGLQSHTRYAWRVCSFDQNDTPSWSDWNAFVTGILPQDRLSPVWITGPNGQKPYYASRRFMLGEKPKAAFLSICGLGQFVAWLNGHRIGKNELDPGWTDYNKRVLYVTFDITPLLRTGLNELTVEVANGWYLGDTGDDRHFYTKAMHYQPFGPVLPLWLRLTARGTKTFCLESGEDFLTWPSQTTLANVYGSEDIDRSSRVGPDPVLAEKEGVARHARILCDSEKPRGVLMAQQHPPVGIKNVYEGVLIDEPEEGVLVFDLGQNMAGLFEVFVRGAKGEKIVVRAAEKRDPEDRGKVRPIVPTFSVYTLSGCPDGERFRPSFSYAAGRYVQVEGVRTRSDDKKKPQLLFVRGHFVTSQARDTGWFCCSEQRYNQIYQLVKKAIESNLNHVHTDCPTVEKLGWLEASQQMAPSIMYCKDVDALWSKIAADIRDAQYGDSEQDVDVGVFPHVYGPGLVPSIAPRYAKFDRDWGQGSYWDIVPWGSTVLLGPWQQYRFYQNKRVLAENYPAAQRYVAYLEQKYHDYSKIYNKSGTERFLCHGLGDWGIGDEFNKSRENIETAFFYYDLVVLGQIAGILGHTEDAQRYLEKAKAVCENYNEHLLVLNPCTKEWCYRAFDQPDQLVIRQANQAIPLYFGMVPEDKKDSVGRSLILASETGVLNCGEIGLRFIFHMLHRLGRPDLIHKMIMSENHPSYARFVRLGETTLPEYWADQGRSRNHDMMGQVVEWFYSGLLGLSSENGYQDFLIAPLLPPELTWAAGVYEAITGRIEIRFEQLPYEHILSVTVPDNTKARLVLPLEHYDFITCNATCLNGENRSIEVGGGRYVFCGYFLENQ